MQARPRIGNLASDSAEGTQFCGAYFKCKALRRTHERILILGRCTLGFAADAYATAAESKGWKTHTGGGAGTDRLAAAKDPDSSNYSLQSLSTMAPLFPPTTGRPSPPPSILSSPHFPHLPVDQPRKFQHFLHSQSICGIQIPGVQFHTGLGGHC